MRGRGCWWWRWWRERRDIGQASHGGLAADSPGSLSPPRLLQTHQVSKTKRTVRRENIPGEAAGRVAWYFASFSDELLQCCSSYGVREVRFLSELLLLLLSECDGADKHIQAAWRAAGSRLPLLQNPGNNALSETAGFVLVLHKLRMIILPPPSPTCVFSLRPGEGGSCRHTAWMRVSDETGRRWRRWRFFH